MATLLAFLFFVQPVGSALAADVAAIPAELPAVAVPTETAAAPEVALAVKLAAPVAATKTGEPLEKEKIGEPSAMSLMSMPGGPSGTPANLIGATGRLLLPEPDRSTGALVYDYPIAVPPGRNGLQPDLKLTYNSQRGDLDTIFGAGWSVNIQYIERMNVHGTDKLYTDSHFYSSLGGELKDMGSGEYGAKVESGSFNKYVLNSNHWTVTDKFGVVYKFGHASSGQVVDPNNSAHTFRWWLEEVRDTNDNYIKYEYYKDGNQAYPSKITYTGNGTTDGIFEVTFLRESRPDTVKSYRSGFLVTTAKRINEVDVKIDGMLRHRYAIAYSNGSNGVRSLVTGVTETGYDEQSTATVLPAGTFTYQTRTVGLTKSANFAFPLAYHYWDNVWMPPFFAGESREDMQGLRMVDINGDALPDLVQSGYSIWGTRETRIFLNKGDSTGWAETTGWTLPNDTDGNPLLFVDNSGYYKDMGVRFADVNGDGFNDIVQSRLDFNWGNYTYTSVANVYINNGTSGWVKDTDWVFPTNYTNGSGQHFVPFFVNDGRNDVQGLQLADVNGDGLPDLVQAGYVWGTREAHAYLNDGDGTGWTEDSSWSFPNDVDSGVITFVDGYYRDMGVRLSDVNGDGLPDLVQSRLDYGTSYTAVANVYVNGGRGWAVDSGWSFPINYPGNCGGGCPPVFANEYRYDTQGLQVFDIDGDGLPDLVQSGYVWGTRATHVYLNDGDGTGWTESTSWTLPNDTDGYPMTFVDGYHRDMGIRMADADGDGLADLVRSRKDPGPMAVSDVSLNDGPVPDRLVRLAYREGGHTDVAYRTTPLYRSGSTLLNPDLPFVLDTAYSVTNDDGNSLEQTTTYSYEGGGYYYGAADDRRFAGFNKVRSADTAGNVRTDYYHQGNTTDTANGEYSDDGWKIGRVYRTETADSSGNKYDVSVNKWDESDLGNGRKFVKLAQKTDLTYDGDTTHKDKTETYSYSSSTGNLSQKVQWGLVTASADGSFTDTGSDKFTTDLSYASNSSAHILGLMSQETAVDQSSNKVKDIKRYYDSLSLGSVDDGNLTKEERWVSGTTYVDTEKTYNSYGLITQSKDERDKATTFSYDSYNLYPATVTNPLSQATQYLYDYTMGQPKQVTDAGGYVFQTIRDGLGRVTAEKQPDAGTPTTLVNKTTYAYTDTSGAVSVKRADWLDADVSADTYTYFDGLKRPIQERREAEGSDFAARDTVYNNRGLVLKESLPYFSSGYAKTTATTTSALYASYAYDALGRVTSLTDAVGTTSTAYDGWKTTVTDARGKAKDLYKDAYGRLVQVDEHNNSSTYTTTYAHDYLGDLTGLVDALGNVRGFTYDGLGRRLTATDLHASGDSTYGSWSYSYDDTGNLTSRTDTKSQAVNWTYDDLNRVTSEDWTGGSGTEVAYAYDTCTNGVGRLCTTTSAALIHSLTYDALGRVPSETKTIDSTGYTTTHTYDRRGSELVATSPDGSQVQNTYGSDGSLQSVGRKESGDSDWTNVVTDIDYAPTGLTTITDYANGAVTTNAYDASHLYRLSSKLTVSGSSDVQSIAYTYDAVGNATGLVDDSDTSTAKTVAYTYDDLNRLLSATATDVASGQSPYTQTWTYDAIGNILTGPAGTYTYAGDQGSSYANPHAATSIGSDTLTYDENGNLLTKGTNNSYTWDYNNRLVSSATGIHASAYSYDSEGTRVKLTEDGTATTFASGGYEITGSVPTKHITANGSVIATVVDSGANAVTRYVHTDHLTGANAVTAQNGAADEILDYYPYGGVRIDQRTGSYTERRQFAGHEFDVATGLSYMGSRYYDSSVGRFLSQDPAFLAVGDTEKLKQSTKLEQEQYLADPQHLNSYSYAFNNPLINVDQAGEFAVRTFGVGAFQVAKSAVGLFSTVSQAVLSGGVLAGGQAQASAILAAGAMGSLDSAMADSVNATANLLGSFKDSSPVQIATQGPYRDAVAQIAGDTVLFDRTSVAGSVMSLGISDVPTYTNKVEAAGRIYKNAAASGVGGASLRFIASKTADMVMKVADTVTQVVTGGKGIMDVVEQGLIPSNKTKK